jgi:alginate O-acetyltransferase complex protein AlgI
MPLEREARPMLFNSAIFLFAFLPIAYFVFWALKTKDSRYIWLTVTGYVFYGYWDPRFCLLMLFSTLVSYTAGLGFLRWGDDPAKRKLLLIVPITIDLTLLGVFKYTGMLVETVNWAFRSFSGTAPLEPVSIILPIGISFYTFHTITYIVDSYRGQIRPTRNFFEFSCYVSLFSQLVAGPIVRFSELQHDLDHIDDNRSREMLDRGWSFFAIGLIQKMLIADSIAAVIDPAFKNIHSLSSAGAWLLMLGYSYQLYFDFCGYSNMAVGLGALFGMHIPQNFNSPYRALNPSDFWRRWHISLSRCLRDYLYIPLGGSRGSELATYRNLMITMLLGGLWHGASWTFVIWGAYHGVLLSIYRRWPALWDRQPEWAQRSFTFILAVFGWVFFRAATFGDALSILNLMVIPHSGELMVGAVTLFVLVLIAGAIAHFGPNTFEMRHQWTSPQLAGLTALVILCLVAMYGGRISPFLYFQF